MNATPLYALIGECMIELVEGGDGRLVRGFGGDSLNTAVYLARLGQCVNYVTALGDDPYSAEMLAAWAAEGVGTDLAGVCRDASPACIRSAPTTRASVASSTGVPPPPRATCFRPAGRRRGCRRLPLMM